MKSKFNLLLLLFLGCFACVESVEQKKIAIISPYGIHPAGPELFDGYNNAIRDEVNKPFYALKAALVNLGYAVSIPSKSTQECHDADYIIFFGSDIALVEQLSNTAQKFCFCFEPPLIAPRHYDKNFARFFTKIFLLCDDCADNSKYFKFFYPQPELKMVSEVVPFKQKKLCTLICGYRPHTTGDLYGFRIAAVSFFENHAPHTFDHYGLSWPQSKCYRGSIKHKKPVLKNYKFCLCYENSRHNGYVTEKIFDAMVAGCVPIYLGAYNITNYIPKECFIDRAQFRSNYDLYNFMQNITEQEYNNYLAAIRNYLSSPPAQKFSVEYFVKTICDLL